MPPVRKAELKEFLQQSGFHPLISSRNTHLSPPNLCKGYNPKTDPIRQADFFINSVKLDSGDLPPVLDIEKRGKDENQLRRDLKLWLDKIEQHYKVKPILYTSYKFKTRYLNDSVFNSYPYWIAHYYVDSVEYRGEWKFWQHTDVGTLPGIREKVDLNIFNGSLEELQLMTIKK